MESITRPVFLPVILGTSRQGRASEHAARFVFDEASKRADMTTELIDIRNLRLSIDDAGEAIKDSQFSATVDRADGLILVVPEYNHSFPGLLKHVLDSCLSEYIHKAVGLVGVSSGPFMGIRVVQNMLPVMRELGLVTIFYDINIGQVGKVFAPDGRLLDEALERRSDRFVRELIWMSKTLREGREHITIDDESAEKAPPEPCLMCGNTMTHHADKLVPAAAANEGEVVVAAAHACGACGFELAKVASVPAAGAF